MADKIQELRALLAQATPGELNLYQGRLIRRCNGDVATHVAEIVTPYRRGVGPVRGQAEWHANGRLFCEGLRALPLLLDVAEAARSVERANTNMLRLLLSGEYTGEEFDAIAGTQNAAMAALRTALAALEGEAGATTTPPATDSRPRHSTNEFGDCPHWCRACAIEARERAALEARNGAE